MSTGSLNLLEGTSRSSHLLPWSASSAPGGIRSSHSFIPLHWPSPTMAYGRTPIVNEEASCLDRPTPFDFSPPNRFTMCIDGRPSVQEGPRENAPDRHHHDWPNDRTSDLASRLVRAPGRHP